MNTRRISAVLLSMVLMLLVAGCKKKPLPPPPPPPPKVEVPPPPPPKPAVQFSAEPSTIERGQSATLRWSVSDATDVSITPGIGTVSARGDRQVSPADTTTYTLSATGPGGAETATATVNVTQPPPPPPPPPPPAPKVTFDQMVTDQLQDAYFDYDKSDIREDARAALTRDADALKQILATFPDNKVVLEGHCDERGSAEYNIGLGDRRATAAKDFLVQLGVPAEKLNTISYGKERPVCTEHDESCWQKNRRAHFSAAQ